MRYGSNEITIDIITRPNLNIYGFVLVPSSKDGIFTSEILNEYNLKLKKQE